MQDKQRQGIFNVVWEPGPDNKADYYTKVLPTSVFANQRQTYVTTPLNNHPKVAQELRRLEYVKMLPKRVTLSPTILSTSKGVSSKLDVGAVTNTLTTDTPLRSLSQGPHLWEVATNTAQSATAPDSAPRDADVGKNLLDALATSWSTDAGAATTNSTSCTTCNHNISTLL